MTWLVYPAEDPDDTDTFASEMEAMNAADRWANATGRDYVVTNRDRTFRVEHDG